MKPGIPGKIVDPCGCLKENHRRAIGQRFSAEHFARNRFDFEVIEPADEAALNALGEEFLHEGSPIIILLVSQPDQQITGNILEQFFMIFGKVLRPSARLA